MKRLFRLDKLLILSLFLLSLFSCKQEVSQNNLPIPQNIKVELSIEQNNTLKISWDKLEGVSHCWVYYSKENNISTAKELTRFGSIQLSYTEEVFQESGTYYFWLKSAEGYEKESKTSNFSKVASFTFTYQELTPPTNFSVSSGTNPNNIKFSFTKNKSAHYRIYYSLENNFSNAKIFTKFGLPSKDEYLTVSGNYYFWITSTDTYDEETTESAPSSSINYNFTFTPSLTKPSITSVTKSYGKRIDITASELQTDAKTTWFYYSKTNDTSTLLEPNDYTFSNTGYLYLPEASGTYYIWVRQSSLHPGSISNNIKLSDFSDPYVFTF